jgi:hypothetical protein
MTTRERAPSPPSKEAGSIMQDSGKGETVFYIFIYLYEFTKKYIFQSFAKLCGVGTRKTGATLLRHDVAQ